MGVENFTGFRWRDPSLGAYQQLLVHFTFEVATCWLRAGWAICKTSAAGSDCRYRRFSQNISVVLSSFCLL